MLQITRSKLTNGEYSERAKNFRSFFATKPPQAAKLVADSVTVVPLDEQTAEVDEVVFRGYLSDLEDDGVEDDGWSDNDEEIATSSSHQQILPHFHVHQPPQPKRCKLDVPARASRKRAKEERQMQPRNGLNEIEKLIKSKQAIFDAGCNGLQASRARAIQSCLHMVVNNGRKLIPASER